jgi:hypothetical protein
MGSESGSWAADVFIAGNSVFLESPEECRLVTRAHIVACATPLAKELASEVAQRARRNIAVCPSIGGRPKPKIEDLRIPFERHISHKLTGGRFDGFPGRDITVTLNFKCLSWPHVSVNTLVPADPIELLPFFPVWK